MEDGRRSSARGRLDLRSFGGWRLTEADRAPTFLFTFRKKQKPPFDFCRSNVPRMLQAAAVVDLFVMAGVCEASTTYLHVPTYLGSPISIFSSCNAAIHFFPSSLSLSLLLNFSLSLYLYCYRHERPLLRFSLCRSFILAYTFTK